MPSASELFRHWWAATASAACVARLRAVADWWHSWPMINTPACLCSCQWWTVWTYLATVNLFSLYLMNFMFHTTLDAVGNILRVHYKSMKCDVLLSQGSVSTLFRWGERVFTRRRSWSFAEYCKYFVSRLNDVRAFGYDSAGSERIWMKFGELRVYGLELSLTNFGRDPRRSAFGRARRNFFVH